MNIKLRDFQHHAAKYIKRLHEEDIILTQYNIPVAKVITINKVSGKTVDTKEWITNCDQDFCKNTAKDKYKLKKYNKETGNEVEVEMYLCPKHYNEAKAEEVLINEL